jgi:hypothetical protein
MSNFEWITDESGDRWLLRLDDDFIHLSAPKSSDDRLLVLDLLNCNLAAWVNS